MNAAESTRPAAAPPRPGRDEPPPGSSLAVALDRLTALFALEPGAVSRVEIDRRGDGPRLTLTVDTADGERWFRASGRDLVELAPAGDGALPLAADLGGDPVLAYRPGRRIVVRRSRSSSVEKGYRRSRFAAAAARHELAARVADGLPGIVLPRLLERRDATASLRFERLDGAPLRLAPDTVERFAELGTAVRALQEAPAASAALPVHGVAEELAVLDALAARVETASGALADAWRRGREIAARRAASLPAATPRLAHRDLHDGQLRIAGDRLAWFDFDLLSRADTALDAGNLLAHLELRRLQRQPGDDAASAAVAGRALRAGLARDAEPGFGQRLAFFRGVSLLRLALVYQLRPRWRRLAPALVLEGVRCLESTE